MFKNPFSFEGRIRRIEYILTYLILNLGTFYTTLRSGMEELNTIIFVLLAIPAYWFLIAQGAKRCHDRGNSGWYQIIPFYKLWMLFGDSDYGENKYGQNPKGARNFVY